MAPPSSRGCGVPPKYFASRRRGRDTSGKAKNNERKLNYEKSKYYIYNGPVRACLLCAFAEAQAAPAQRHQIQACRRRLTRRMGTMPFSPSPPALYNSAFGLFALLSITDGNFNTAVGAGALLVNTASTIIRPLARQALLATPPAPLTRPLERSPLFTNADGSDNNAVGDCALF